MATHHPYFRFLIFDLRFDVRPSRSELFLFKSKIANRQSKIQLAPVAQLSERRASNAEVAGEIPAGSAIFAALAQLAEAPRSERGG